jgi:hypothetical protein
MDEMIPSKRFSPVTIPYRELIVFCSFPQVAGSTRQPGAVGGMPFRQSKGGCGDPIDGLEVDSSLNSVENVWTWLWCVYGAPAMFHTQLHSLRVLLLVLVCLLMGCGNQPNDSSRTRADTGFEKNKALLGEILRTDRLIVYEGLPRFRKEQVEQDKDLKQELTLHGYQFFKNPHEVSAEDKKSLQELLGDSRSFHQWVGHKMCGGFHPDYLVEYRVGESIYRILLCFGCHEIMIYGPDSSLWCDMNSTTYEKLLALLKKYDKNVPDRKIGI